MGRQAEAALLIRRPVQTAIQLLDMICKPFEGCDAEFEADDPAKPGHEHPVYTYYTDPLGPLGQLIAEAFAPERNWIADWVTWEKSDDFGNEGNGNVRDLWYEGPKRTFSRRYDFWAPIQRTPPLRQAIGCIFVHRGRL